MTNRYQDWRAQGIRDLGALTEIMKILRRFIEMTDDVMI